jgi:mannosylglycerate hydrolase MGH1-like protein
MSQPGKTQEHVRLEEARSKNAPWRKWGPYLSERQWGSVRENLTQSIEAWNDVTHDQSRSRAYQSGEDGIAGFCDENMLVCFSLGLWNGKDAILKERLFGLTNSEGNHGEDVKEYYFYLDNTPTHSYAKMLYKYPQAAFPYLNLVDVNRARSKTEFEYELLDTGVFDDDRYWDVFVEYAKGDPEDIHIRITAFNRGPEAASLDVLPQLVFRNTWWADPVGAKPELSAGQHGKCAVVIANHPHVGTRYLYCDQASELLFTDNETNRYRLWGQPNPTQFQKDGINDYVVQGRKDAVNPARRGTKAASRHPVTVNPGGSATIRLRLTNRAPTVLADPFGSGFDQTFADRTREADEFYGAILPRSLSDDAKNVVRQGYSGLLWSKQAYVYNVEQWLNERGVQRDSGGTSRNQHWFHMYSADVISMPDKWEYPWFASWDLAFHAVALAFVDPDFAHEQLGLMLLDRYQHPNGQLPAYEWNFDDVNPPVHAWATIFNYRMNRDSLGDEALPFLKRTFQMLVPNFTWWLNRKDRDGRNLFEGGFLGLDNIGVFDRSAPLPTGGYLEQADGTAWMAFYAQNMLDIALELALVDPTYEPMAVKFYEHVIAIAAAANRQGARDSMWDEEDGFYYDVLRVPGQFTTRIKVRSIVGLLPLCAVSTYRPEVISKLPLFMERVAWFNKNRPDLLANLGQPGRQGAGGRFMLSLLSEDRLRRVLKRMLDPAEFLGDHGIRSLSRHHLENPYVFYSGGEAFRVGYLPAESDSGMFGGNSNWRGPIWAPMNALFIRALLSMYAFYGDSFKVECPTGSGQHMNLYEVAQELSNRLASLFLRDHEGRRPVYGGTKKFVDDPHWKDHLLFYEYFHGDNGAGLGASHQTGWTAVIPALMHLFAELKPEMLLAPEHPLSELVRDKQQPGVRLA